MDNIKELLLEIQKSVNGIKADLILMKYDIEQIDAKLNNVPGTDSAPAQEQDPFNDRRFTQL
jgi:hypothetical protein